VDDSPRRPASRRPRRALLLAALAVVAIGCRDKGTVMNRQAPSDSLGSIARELKLTFPASTRLVGVDREQGMDDRIRVKVEMTPADVAAFLGQTSIEPSSFRPGARGRLGLDSGFWDPSRAANLRTASVERDNRVLNIGLDETHPDATAVFIVDHGL
jgi:hypothetical protein